MLNTRDRDLNKGSNYSERVINIIIHEAKNLLTTINFSSEILLEISNSEEKALARTINKSGKKMGDLFSSYHKLMQIERGEYERELEEELILNKVSSIIEDYEKDFKRKEMKVVFDRKDAYEILVTDWFCLDFALRNVLRNAIETAPRGDTITLTLQKRFDGFYIDIQNAVAMPQEMSTNFSSVGISQNSRYGESEALGTYITKKMIEALGGTITFKASKGKGNSIRIKLP